MNSEEALTFPWSFTSDEFLDIRKKLTNPNLPLITNVFSGIFQGIRSGANEVFIVDRANAKTLEQELLIPFVSGREIKRQYLSEISNYLVFPYFIDEFRSPSLISEENLSRNYEAVYKHLLASRGQLIERSLENGSQWYGYSRSQSLNTFLKPKLFVKEMMPRAEFAYDVRGEIAFGSGYALDASFLQEDELALWAAVLNTPIMEFSLRNIGTQLHSGWFRVMKHQLIRLRLPSFTTKQIDKLNDHVIVFNRDPEGTAGEKALNSITGIVASSFGLDASDVKKIAKFLEPIHNKSIPASRIKDPRALDAEPNYEPVKIERYNTLHRERFDLQQLVTFRNAKTKPIHSWYPYTQGFDEELVLKLIAEFELTDKSVVLDPFGGVGTTGIACRKMGIKSISNDISPLAQWIAQVKNSNLDISKIEALLDSGVFQKAEIYKEKVNLNPNLFSSFFANAYAPEVLDKVVRILAYLDAKIKDREISDFLKLIVLGRLESMSNIRKHGSHYRYLNSETSVGLEKLNIPIFDSQGSVSDLLAKATEKALKELKEIEFFAPSEFAKSLLGDSRNLDLSSNSIDAVITSPPYLNRNNYIAQQKGELALLGFVSDSPSYKDLVKSTLISHVEGTLPASSASEFSDVNTIIDNISLTEGNNPKIPFMISGYFSDMNDVFLEMWRVCRSGAKLAFVVGNARWGGVVIPVDHLLMQQAEKIGFIPEKILVTRFKGNSPQQMRRFGRIPVRESIIVFSKP